MNDRDTKFQGFAKLLLDEIMTNNEVWFDTADDTFKEDWQQIIAQRAYDLVGHTIDSLWPYINDKAVEPTPSDIPDLTQWTESSTE